MPSRRAAASVQRGVPTSARINAGALVERAVPYTLAGWDHVRLSLRNPDLTTARRVVQVVNRATGGASARATDPPTVLLNLGGRDPVAFLTDIEQLRVEPDQAARVVIEEASGMGVMGAQVRVSNVAIAQGNLTIRISETPQVSQPDPWPVARRWWCRAPDRGG